MTTVYIARHGQTDWNVADIVQGQCESLLNDTGRAQANALALELADVPFVTIIYSDLKRTVETASIIARFHPGAELISDPRLRERDFGLLEGLSGVEVENSTAGVGDMEKAARFNMETEKGAAQRLAQAVWHYQRSSKGKKILFVTHSGTMLAYLDRAEILNPLFSRARVVNASYFVLRCFPNMKPFADLRGLLPIVLGKSVVVAKLARPIERLRVS